ncbi:Tetraspanin [Parasponia andersonii]|uniref:Tetraspanin n=1 Tax=Parasponia andersonii TaxID=3476 RepID=A0A2P5AJW8_PARAD|nr:Tetraspanin [Parasponia andersonii]
MVVTVAKTCLKSFLKVVNSTLGIIGIAMILYGLWMIRVWQRDMEEYSSFDDFISTTPWFIYTFLGAGVTLCLITCLGHLAASVANETAIAADIALNSDWEKDLPNDPTGRFKDFKDFVKSNFETFKWIGLVIVLAQGLSILVSMVLRSIGPNKVYDSDDEYTTARLPLIKDEVQPAPYVVDVQQGFASKNINSWKTNK